MTHSTSYPQSFSVLRGKLSMMTATPVDKDPFNQNRNNSGNLSRSSATNVTINSNIPIICSYRNDFISSKNVVMINPEYLQRISYQFSSSLNLKSYKFNTVDNSASNEKKMFRRYSTSDLMQSFNLEHTHEDDQSLNATNNHVDDKVKELQLNEKKRKAASLDELCNIYQSPTTRTRLKFDSTSSNFKTQI